MPPKGATQRAKHNALLTSKIQGLKTDSKIDQLLKTIKKDSYDSSLDVNILLLDDICIFDSGSTA